MAIMAQSTLQNSEASPAAQSARGSSFYAAMRIMPPKQRSAMYEIYRFCRAVDDIADDEKGDVKDRLAALAQWRMDIADIYEGKSPPSLENLAKAVAAFGLTREDFLAVIDGMEMDVKGPIQAPDMATLMLYCDRVACAVGRLSVRVFGLSEPDGRDLSHHLGLALQLTNILRDIDEDGALGRLYLPKELLEESAITSADPAEVLHNIALPGVCLKLAQIVHEHFVVADKIMDRSERKHVRAPRIMSQAYCAIHQALLARGFASPRRRVRLNKAKLGLILVKNFFF